MVVSLILSLVFIGLFLVIPSTFASYHQVQALFEKGFEALQNGEFAKAVSFFDQVLEIDPNYVPALNNKGSALRILGMYEEAIVYFDKAL
ncbi:MAG: tetratricopeptide repeat protein, partial [Thaumarchaeota archaeon]|nr:tetratricopeptide repeat protein [Nitrososphaerota archaeon]